MVTTGSVSRAEFLSWLEKWNRVRLKRRKKKPVKTGSCLGSVWCRELGYFWRSRGRARAVSFLVCYSFLYKLEFVSEPLVVVTPPVPLFQRPMIIADLRLTERPALLCDYWNVPRHKCILVHFSGEEKDSTINTMQLPPPYLSCKGSWSLGLNSNDNTGTHNLLVRSLQPPPLIYTTNTCTSYLHI